MSARLASAIPARRMRSAAAAHVIVRFIYSPCALIENLFAFFIFSGQPPPAPKVCVAPPLAAELFRRRDLNSTERGDHQGFDLVIESLGCCQERCVIVNRNERRGHDVSDGASAVW